MNKLTTIAAYFEALNERDVEAAARAFHPRSHTVRNAAQPAISGPEAMAETVRGLFARTESVQFTVRSMCEDGDTVLADWQATFVFAEGAVLNGQRTHRFRVSIEGIDAFVFDADGFVVDCQIMHETATVARAAAAHPAAAPETDRPDPAVLVQRYLTAEETEDRAALAGLFAENVVVRNAANPVDAAPGSVDRYLTSFWERTVERKFALHSAAYDSTGAVLAYFTSVITFAAGTAFGPVVAREEFTVELPTALRFQLDGAAKITEVTVVHETTTAMVLASGGAK